MLLEVASSTANKPLKKSHLFIELNDLPKFEVPSSLTSEDDESAPLREVTTLNTRPLIRSPLIRSSSFQTTTHAPQKMLAMTPPLPRFSQSVLPRPRSEEQAKASCNLSRQEKISARKALSNLVAYEDMHKIIEIEYMFMNGRSLFHPGRIFVKEGELLKDTGKAASPRHFFLFTDALVYGTPTNTSKSCGYLDNQTIISLAYAKVESVCQKKCVLRLYTKKEAFSVIASSEMEYTSWFHALQNSIACHKTKIETEAKKRRMAAIKNGKRRSSFSLDMNLWRTIKSVSNIKDDHGDRSSDSSRSTWSESQRKCSVSSSSSVSSIVNSDSWVPDQDASLCMSCKVTKFSLMVRRHHCRLCGRVICWKCSHLQENIEPSGKLIRICQDCWTWKAVGAVISHGENVENPHFSQVETKSVIRGFEPDVSSAKDAPNCRNSFDSSSSEFFVESPE
ncbi:hypothetical protein K493DRAFT_311810 [Basidiobolus meristosporus CBS 931.73]|uniref:FYVE-domain-containing protein n=1 Tax=Basidiobolus meristosporus CBS 931.73 TaxID=1314790 RepID=A0A1Y1YYR8_9FUNG|nr:hypothetical protein K493DRAFT_311810 [Basidiobolus meristosporus CBS 931.73]|eukprot:ORY03188.1 hypothetical protein K493DRAFT_311810 [Basidiobolus meristosporus CBS 931.73]